MFSTHLNLESSPTVAMNSLASEKKARGERVYNLSAGEPELPVHPAIAAAALKAISDNKTLYPPVSGIPELRAAASEWLNKIYGAAYEINNTLITCGGKFGIFSVIQAFVQPGDEVIILSPYWVSYPQIVRLFGGKPVFVSAEEKDGWKIDFEKLKKAVTTKTKMLILNNASNPTGVLYSRGELFEIMQFAAKHNLLVLSDEVYSGLAFDSEYVSAASLPEFRDRTLVVQSCSKNFAMTGWRVGLLFGPEPMIKILTMIQGQSTTGTSSVSQYAALAAVQNADKIIPWVRQEMRERRDVFVNTFNDLFGAKLKKPESGLYSFFPLSLLGVDDNDSLAFSTRALEAVNVALVPGVAFGAEGYVRASFGANKKKLKEALMALKKIC